MKYDLNRFKKAQQTDYLIALQEICSGRKLSHWIWYIFPQLKGLGQSTYSNYYGIQDASEAAAYLSDPYLGGNLREISAALLELESNSAREVMGKLDERKLQSSMTLFASVSEDNQVFLDVLYKYFGGKKDIRTLHMLGKL